MTKVIKNNLGNNEIFSKNLLRYLKDAGKTQVEVAEAIGVSAGTFCDYVKGKSYPRMDKVQKLADYFGINKSDLVEERDLEKERIEAENKEVLELFHRVPKEKRELVLSLIRSVIDNL